MFIEEIVIVVLLLQELLCLNRVKGRTCTLDYQETFSRSCGSCGVCKATLQSEHQGRCDDHYLITSGLFLQPQGPHCVLKNYCENYKNLCKNDSLRFTGVCLPLFGTYLCECKRGFFGKNCEKAEDLEFTFKTLNYKRNRMKHLAVVQNVVFTPIFYCLDFATILISLQNTGFNLGIYIDNGREKLYYNKKKCEKNFFTNEFCKSLFSEFDNIRICEGKDFKKPNHLRNEKCLIALKVPFPRVYDKNRAIYQYIDKGRSSDNPVLGNLETVTVEVNNNFGKFNNKQVFKYTFNVINIHETSDPRTHCAPRIRLINCGTSMENMPSISRYTDLIILRSVTTKNQGPFCQEFGKFQSVWKIWRIQENHDELKDTPLLKMFDSMTYVPNEKALEYGVYKVQLTVVNNLMDFIVPEIAYCYFKVICTPIQTTILGGSLRTIYYKQSIIFDVFSSVIPDRHNLDKGMKIVYKWHCNDLHEQFCKPSPTTNTTRIIKGPFQYLKSYSFTVNTKVIQKYAVTIEHPETQAIEVTSGTVVTLAIICSKNCGGSVFKSNPQEIILLEVSSRQPLNENIILHWKYKCLEDNDDFQDVNTIQDKDSSQSKLLIKRNKLKEGRKYVFLVTLVGSVSSAEITIGTGQSPRGVVCEVFPKSGIRGETMFSISCKNQEKADGFPSLTYEFYDRYKNESIGRIVGYSATGVIAELLLTRERLFVRATNFFGIAVENAIGVKLSSPVKKFSPSLITDSENELINKDYIYRMGLISAYSDLSGSQLFWSDEMQIFLDHLSKEENQPQDIMGALMLKNALFVTACDKLIAINSETTILECDSILSVAKIMHQVTHRLQNSLHKNNTNWRILSTTRTQIFVNSILECSNFILTANFLTDHIRSDLDVHECLKTSTYFTIDTLDDLVYIIALQMPLIQKQKFKAKSVAVSVEEMRSHTLDDSVIKTSLDVTKTQEDFKYYIQQVSFSRNPFWWGSGSKINTNVYSFQLNSGNSHIRDPNISRIVHFEFKVNKFQSLFVQGSVKQPDPKKKPQVNDFEVVVYRIDPETHSETFIEFVNFVGKADIKVLILYSERPDFDLMTTKATEVTQMSQKWSFGLKGKKNTTFYYMGILPGPQVDIGMSVNYSFTLYSARCAVWKYRSWISGERCAVNKTSSDMNRQLLVCSCTLLTITVGGYVYNPIINLNPFSDLPLFLKISENTASILLLLISFLIFSVLLIWTKKRDKEDTKKKIVLVFEDNNKNDPYMYLIAVFTGSRFGAGTTSNVGIKLYGETAMSRIHVFSSSQQPILQCGGDDWFLLTTPQHLGSLLQIRLWIDYSGLFPNWFCRKVMVCDLRNSETCTFIVEKWFGINMNGVRMESITKGAASHQVNTFRLLFFHNFIRGLREFHIYVSIFFKHPRSLINRTQRLSVALCCVLVAMVTTTLLYSLSTPIFEDFANYEINSNTFVICFISSLSATVVRMITMHYFRKSYKIVGNKRESLSDINLNSKGKYNSEDKNYFCLKKLYKYTEKYVSSCKIIPIGNTNNTMSLEENSSSRNSAWMICLAIAFVSVYIIAMASLTYGENKRSIWLTSLTFSGLITFFILIPIKVFFTAVLLSLLKIRYFDLMSHNVAINKFLKSVKSNKDMKVNEKYKSMNTVRSYISCHDLHYERVKKIHYRTIRIWIFIYILEALILIGLIVWVMMEFETYNYFYANTAVCSEMLTVEMCAKFYDVDIAFSTLIVHVHEYMLPKLYSNRWYNGHIISSKEGLYEETGWMKDANSRLIGDPHLLQVRVQRNLCRVPKIMSKFAQVCLPSLSSNTVDRDNYSLSWTHDDWTEIELFSESPWEFVQGSGIGVRTPSDYYLREGAYVATLLRTLDAAELVYTNLIDTNWIDERTRVIVLEFVTYNVNNNMITSSYFVTETYPTNVIKIAYTIRSERHDYHKASFKAKLFIFFSLYFLIRTLVLMNIMGFGNFFENLWNCYDVFFSVLYIVTTLKYIYWLYLSGTDEGKSVMDKNRHVYLEVLFQAKQEAVIYLCYTFGAATARLVRIARINDNCKTYLSNLVKSRTELLLTLLLSFSSMYIMFRLIMYYLEPPTVYDFMDILVFQSDFHSFEGQYDDLTGKLSAFVLSRLSDITMFSFTISLIHHQRQITLRRLSLTRSPQEM